MKIKLLTLKEVLNNADKYEWKLALYCQGNKPFQLETKCAVLDANLIENEETKPEFIIKNKLSYKLGMETVKGIVENLKRQSKLITSDKLLEAFNFYMMNDAFINLI